MRNLRLSLLWAAVIAMALAGCGGGGAAISETSAVAEPAPVGTSDIRGTASTPSAVSPAAAAPTVDSVLEVSTEQDLNLDSVSEGLAQLSSYKSKLIMRFTGKDPEGQAVDNWWIMEEEFILEPRAQRVVWTSSESTGGMPAETSSYEIVTIGQTSYMTTQDASGAETCVTTSSSDATPPEQILSADMWGSISDARYVNTETVNGIRAKHYTWDEGSLASLGYVIAKGDTWVAADGGYVVRQAIELTGKGLFLAGTDDEGTSTWQWDVTEANAPFEILAPEGCESAAQDIPMLDDAADIFTFGDTISYTSPSAFADVLSFYKSEMPSAGWQPSGTPWEGEDFAMLEFTKDERTASVSLSYSESDQTTSVVVSVSQP